MTQYKHRGFANELPNWQEPWCEVIYDSADVPKGYGNGIVTGIRHGFSTNVKLHTYQFAICDSEGVITSELPDSTSVGMGFTVFGVRSGSSGVESSAKNTANFEIWPSIANASVNVSTVGYEEAMQFLLIDPLGRIYIDLNLLPGTQRFDVITSDLPSGIYIGRLMTTTGMEVAKFIVQH